jgi:uncharacterized circularly permuted ATP-grasp superfamily protein
MKVAMTDLISEYNALLAADPGSAVEQAGWLDEEFVRGGITFDGAPMRSFLRPHLLERHEWRRLRDDGRRLLELAARVARYAFGGDVDRLCDFLGTPENERHWVRLDPGPPDVLLSRLDAFVGDDGPRFIEINSDAPAGLGYGDRMADAFMRLPVFRAFRERHAVAYPRSVPAVVESVLHVPTRTATPVVAIVDFADVKTRGDQVILQRAFEERGVRCLLADPREMDLHDGWLWSGKQRVDLVYRRAVLSELLEKKGEVAPFLRAYDSRVAVFVNSFRCRLSEDKAFFALLTDETFAALMNAEERALAARCVPWTRRVAERRTLRGGREVDLLPHVIERREEMVLKPAHGYGGRSVYIGSETPAGEWEGALQAACGGSWVVQERVAIPEEVFPVFESGTLAFDSFKLNANPFYVGGAEVGAVARASRSSVINVSAGGGSVPTFVVG